MSFETMLAKLRDREYRKAFVSSQINIGIPFQIRALIKSRGWTQGELAQRTGMLQPRISALLTPGKVRPNIETLRRVAEAFDCGLEVRFVPFSELVCRSETFDPENFNIPTFGEEITRAEERENSLVAAMSIPTESAYVTVETVGVTFSGGVYSVVPMSMTAYGLLVSEGAQPSGGKAIVNQLSDFGATPEISGTTTLTQEGERYAA